MRKKRMSSAAAEAWPLTRKGSPTRPARRLRRAMVPLHEAPPLRDALPLWRIGVMDDDASFVRRTTRSYPQFPRSNPPREDFFDATTRFAAIFPPRMLTGGDDTLCLRPLFDALLELRGVSPT